MKKKNIYSTFEWEAKRYFEDKIIKDYSHAYNYGKLDRKGKSLLRKLNHLYNKHLILFIKLIYDFNKDFNESSIKIYNINNILGKDREFLNYLNINIKKTNIKDKDNTIIIEINDIFYEVLQMFIRDNIKENYFIKYDDNKFVLLPNSYYCLNNKKVLEKCNNINLILEDNILKFNGDYSDLIKELYSIRIITKDYE